MYYIYVYIVSLCFQVSVRTVDGVQGLEFRTLIISTVRTCSLLSDNEEDAAGFLSNPKVWFITHSYIVYMYDV